jgi:hypothetical protein
MNRNQPVTSATQALQIRLGRCGRSSLVSLASFGAA